MNEENRQSVPEILAEQVKAAAQRAQQVTDQQVDAWVEEREKLRDQAVQWAEDATQQAQQRIAEIGHSLEGVRDKAAGAFGQLEQIFEERVSRALQRLGVPSRDDLRGIAERLDDINRRVQALAEERQAAAQTAPVPQDDLQLINGIGPVLESKLKAAGIHCYQQIAQLTDAEIGDLPAEVIRRIHREDWAAQARELHARKYGEAL